VPWQSSKLALLAWALFQVIAYFVLALHHWSIIGASFDSSSVFSFPPHG